MQVNLLHLIDAFAGLRVLVIGDPMLDSYLEGAAASLCREAPVPVVTLTDRTDAPGGAANTAANVASLGGGVTLLGVIGADAEGATLRRILAERGIDANHLIAHPQRTTLAKHRLIASAQILVRFDQGCTSPIDALTEERLLEQLEALFAHSDAVIVSDYGYGVLTERIIAALARLQARTPRVLVVDAKNLAAYRHVGVTAVKPNYAEAGRLLGLPPERDPPARIATMTSQGGRLLGMVGTQIAAITLDTDGALIFERGNPPYRTYAQPRSHSHAAGAGDTFVSALALALAAGAHTPAAAELASAAAAVVVARDGTITCAAEELRATVAAADRLVADSEQLAARVAIYRRQGRRIVFANGCFDLLHRGHITLLNQAKALGDVLIVGVNSDASIRRIKGAGRPINRLEDRMQVLAALSCIDQLVVFDDDTPAALLRAVRPDVFVKGGNYTRDTLPETDLVERLGGRVHILPYLTDYSTNGLIARIRAGAGAAEQARAVGAD